MGYRAHVCTTYRVRYGTGCFSAAACDAVNRLLENYEYPDGDGGRKSLVEYCDAEETVMELSREGLESLVASLEKGMHYSNFQKNSIFIFSPNRSIPSRIKLSLCS